MADPAPAAETAPRPDAEAVPESADGAALATVLDRLTDPFAAVDTAWRLTFLNRRTEALLHGRREDLIGKDVWETYPQLTGSRIHRECHRAMDERAEVDFEEYVPALNAWYQVYLYPSSEGLSIYARDISGRKRAEELQERLQRLRALRADVGTALSGGEDLRGMLRGCAEAVVRHLDAAFARIWIVDPEEQVLVLSASAGQYTHLNGAHGRVKVGQFKIGLIAQEGLPHLTNDVQHDARVSDKEWARREGLVAFAGYPLLAEGRVLGVMAMFARQPLQQATLEALGSIVDTVALGIERANAQRALAQRVKDLARSNVELEQFAYVASHDLQEPLRMVASYTQLLARRYKGKLDADADEFIGYAVDGVTRMQRLINDLLTYSRVGTRGKAPAPTDCEQVLSRALANLEVALAESGGVVTHGPLPTVTADDGQLLQLFQNLIGNGLKFHRPQPRPKEEGKEDDPPRVHVSAEQRGEEWVFAVCDNGIGIEAQYFERIFVIFQRLHAKGAYPGTGVGLSICKKIVERHGGRIWVESEPGHGSTFYFSLPYGGPATGPPRDRVDSGGAPRPQSG